MKVSAVGRSSCLFDTDSDNVSLCPPVPIHPIVATGGIFAPCRNRKNSVENVFITNPVSGLWTVEVFGDEIVQDERASTSQLDADFALVVRASGMTRVCAADFDANGQVE